MQAPRAKNLGAGQLAPAEYLVFPTERVAEANHLILFG